MNLPSSLTRFAAVASGAIEPHHATIRKAASFAAIGLVNTAVDFGIFAFGYGCLGLPLVPANVLAWLVAITGSYTFNSLTTFAQESGRRLQPRAYGIFVISGIAGLVANTATVLLLSYVLPVLVAKLFAIGVSFAVNFLMSYFVVFRKKPTES